MGLSRLREQLRGGDKDFMPRWIIASMLAQGHKLPDWYGPSMEALPDLPTDVVEMLEEDSALRSCSPGAARRLIGAADYSNDKVT